MKILGSEITFSSEHQYDQLDLSLNEKQTRTTFSSARQGPSTQRTGLARMMVDRVSISKNQMHEFQSNYAADVSSKSIVTTIHPGDATDEQAQQTVISHEQKNAMEKLVGGVINKEVIINSIASGSDVVLRGGDTNRKVVNNSIAPDSGVLLGDGVPRLSNTNSNFVDLNSLKGRVSPVTPIWNMSLTQTDIHFEEEQMVLSSAGNVTTEDGRQIDFSLDMSLNRTFVSRTQEQTLIKRWKQEVNLTDPLVISLDGNAPTLSDAQFEFDLDSDGKKESISFLNSGSGFLAFDKNGDQAVNDGSELFGPGTGNGFEELAAWDDDHNHWIDENDDIFSKLSVWTRNEDGEDQLMSLKDAGVGAIALDYASTQFDMTSSENDLQGQMKSTGVFLFEDGNIGSVSQIDLAARPVDASEPESANAIDLLTPAPDSEITGPQIGSAMAAAPEDNPVQENPLKDLLDRIQKLKDEIGRLYEKMSLAAPEHGPKRRGGKRFRAEHMNASMLLSGYTARQGRSHRRFV